MIGILIAFQINNWNVNRKEDVLKQEMLLTLKQEFQGNLEKIKFQEDQLKKSNKYLIKVLNFSAGADNKIPVDSLRIYASGMIFLENPGMTKSALDGTIASGDIGLLDDSLKRQLRTFEADFNIYISNESDNLLKTDEIIELMLNFKTVQPFHNRLYPDTPLATHPYFEKNDRDFEDYIKSSKTYSDIKRIYLFALTNEVWIAHLKNKISTILKEIEKGLESEKNI